MFINCLYFLAEDQYLKGMTVTHLSMAAHKYPRWHKPCSCGFHGTKTCLVLTGAHEPKAVHALLVLTGSFVPRPSTLQF